MTGTAKDDCTACLLASRWGPMAISGSPSGLPTRSGNCTEEPAIRAGREYVISGHLKLLSHLPEATENQEPFSPRKEFTMEEQVYRTELTPVSFLERSAAVFPDKTAVVH